MFDCVCVHTHTHRNQRRYPLKEYYKSRQATGCTAHKSNTDSTLEGSIRSCEMLTSLPVEFLFPAKLAAPTRSPFM